MSSLRFSSALISKTYLNRFSTRYREQLRAAHYFRLLVVPIFIYRSYCSNQILLLQKKSISDAIRIVVRKGHGNLVRCGNPNIDSGSWQNCLSQTLGTCKSYTRHSLTFTSKERLIEKLVPSVATVGVSPIQKAP